VLDPHPWVLRWSEIEKLYRENPSLRFRVLEGCEAFEQIYGANRLLDLPAPTPIEVALAQLFDLKSRLTYLNMFCLTRTFTDQLEARRKEYLLFKLTVELARIALFLSSGIVIFRRREVLRRFVSAALGKGEFLVLGDDLLLHDFVVHTARFRLRRPFCHQDGVLLDLVEEKVLRAALGFLRLFYARSEIRGHPAIANEYEHFYAGAHFLPTGHTFRRVPEGSLEDYPRLKQGVINGNTAGIDTVLEMGDLLINLSNGDPRLGNCTVVARPAGSL
jgi:hypothetical protein